MYSKLGKFAVDPSCNYGKEMRINLWPFRVLIPGSGSLGSAKACPCWRHVSPEQTQSTEDPQLLQRPSVSLPSEDKGRSHQSGFAAHSEVSSGGKISSSSPRSNCKGL